MVWNLTLMSELLSNIEVSVVLYGNCNFISGCWHGNKKGSCQVQGYKKVLESQNWWTAYVHSLIYSEEGKTLVKKKFMHPCQTTKGHATTQY